MLATRGSRVISIRRAVAKWHDGYWTRPPYEGAYWVQPYHVGGQYFTGRWEGSRGNVAHDHRWDRGTQRDERREPRDDNRR